MPRIKRNKYGGVWPSAPEEAVGTVYARDALNVDVSRGTLAPFRAPRQVSTETGASLFVDGCRVLTSETPAFVAHNDVGCDTLFRTGVAPYPEYTDDTGAEPTWHRLGIPAPAYAPTAIAINPVVRDESSTEVSYAYAYVNAKNQLGPLSVPSNRIETNIGAPRMISGIVWPDATWEVQWVNVYVTAVGTKDPRGGNPTQAAWRYVGTVTPGSSSYTHDGVAAGMTADSLLYEPPPADLTSIAFSPEANVLAGISPSKGYVVFSEPFATHAFPVDYYTRFGDTPKRIVCNDVAWFVLTDGCPYILPLLDTGGLRKPNRIMTPLPVVSAQSVAAFPGGVIYASKTGLVILGNNGAVSVATYPLIRDEDWMAIYPHQMVGAVFNGYYYGSSPRYAFRFKVRTGVFTLEAADEFMPLSLRATAMHAEKHGALFYADQEGVHQWADGAEWLPYSWESLAFRPGPRFAWRVATVARSPIGELSARHKHDDIVVLDRDVPYNRAYSLPRIGADTVAAMFYGTAEVFSDTLATTTKDLAG